MQKTEGTTDEQEIRKLDAAWGQAASRYDLDAVVGFYAQNGSVVWPGAPAAHGTAHIRAAWQQMFALYKGLTLDFTPERIDLAQGGQLAADFGKVAFGHDTPQGRVEETAKYVVVWKKVDNIWKVLYDCYNMNSFGD